MARWVGRLSASSRAEARRGCYIFLMSRHLLGRPAFLAVALAVQAGVVWAHVADAPREKLTGPAAFGEDGYLFGDSGVYAVAAHSLLADRDLDLLNQLYPDKPTLADALPELEGAHGGEFGLAAGGYLTIKQSPVLSAVAVPFYAAFGQPGFLVFNLVVLNLLLVGTAKLAGDTPAARAVVLIGFATTPLRHFTFTFSPDLFLCALLVGSVLAARANRPTWAGALAGLAVSTKLYVAAFALPIPLVVWAAADGRGWAALAKFAIGGLLGLAPGLGFNTWLFGAPWVTGYERQILVTDGRLGLATHTARFVVPLGEGLRNLMLYPGLGLVPTAPLWLLWPLASGLLLTRRFAPASGRAWVLAAVAVIVVNLAVMAPYDGWHAGALDGGPMIGNRYLFPAVVFGVALIGAATGAVVRVATARKWGQSADAARPPGPAVNAG